MIVLVVKIGTTAEKIAALKSAIVEMQKASRAEPGCRDYTFCVEIDDPNKLRVNECWEDEAALKSHFATPHMAAFNEAIAAAGPSEVNVACYEASEIPFPVDRG
jgi:quinol monooxygenase YgiN